MSFRHACECGFIRARGCFSNCWVMCPPWTRFPERTWGMMGMSLRCVLLIEKTDVTRPSKRSDAKRSAPVRGADHMAKYWKNTFRCKKQTKLDHLPIGCRIIKLSHKQIGVKKTGFLLMCLQETLCFARLSQMFAAAVVLRQPAYLFIAICCRGKIWEAVQINYTILWLYILYKF